MTFFEGKNTSDNLDLGILFFIASRSNAHLAGVGEIFDRVLIELVGKMKEMRMVRPLLHMFKLYCSLQSVPVISFDHNDCFISDIACILTFKSFW